ncbi:MAG: DUF115 domain-containing protein [Magnetococcales bacterium]|nr:DUF115 domain-containing protein [Magnetococcales bacterium]NGZ25657.1 DUF115 domain-containing protein [Magnetococcales bacterium]
MAVSEEMFGQFLYNAFGEPYLPELVRESFSQTGSQAIYERCLANALKRENTLFIFVGCDGGLLLRHLSHIPPQKGSRYLVVEFDELLALATKAGVIPEEVPEHITLCNLESLPEVSRSMGIEDYYRLDSIFLAMSTTVELGLHPLYRQLWKDVNLFSVRLKFEMYNTTGTVMNFLSQTLKNLPETRHPASVLHGLFKGLTAVMLAGGPSLAEILPWVKENRSKLVVLAVARIAHLLEKEGIVPECYFAVDPYDLSFFNCREMLVGSLEPLLVGTYHMNSRLLGQWPGRFVCLGPPFPWETSLNPPDNKLFLGTTVAHQAVGMAMRMGCERVILAGVDLCFSKEGITHTKGTLESQMGPWIPSSDLQVETNGGWMAETWYDLYYDIPSMGALAGLAKENGCTIINPAAASAKIANVLHLPLAEITLEPLPDDPKQRIRHCLPEDGSPQRIHHYQLVMDELQRVLAEVEKIGELAAEALECNDRLFGRLGAPPDFQYKKRMDAIEEALQNTHRVMNVMVRTVMIESLLGLSQPDKERQWSDEEVEETGRKYYQYYVDGSRLLQELLSKTRDRVASRLAEEGEVENLVELAQQWLGDDQPGRYRVVLTRKNLAQPPVGWSPQVEELQTLFQEHLTTQDSTYRKQFDEMLTPTAVLSKIMGFYQDKSVERLEHFAAGLAMSQLENVEQFILLIKGFISDLTGEHQKATTLFRRITLPLLQEEAMRGLLTIALRQGDLFTAQAVLHRLSTISPVFYNYLAEVQRLRGDGPGSLDALLKLLKYMPEDPVTLIKIARQYLELGQKGEAVELLHKVVDKYPENQAALTLLALL